jgi:hypothetical protein
MKKLAREVARGVLREQRKQKQADAMPTLLLVDVAQSDLPDVRSWADAFDSVWQRDDKFIAVGAMVTNAHPRLALPRVLRQSIYSAHS